MTRCIHCTRCVRFANEVVGLEFFGTIHRGNRLEINTYREHLFTSEISSNVIDLCPVGSLTYKLFNFKITVVDPWKCTEIFRRQSLTVKTNFISKRMYNIKKEIEEIMELQKELILRKTLRFLNTVKNHTDSILKNNLKVQKELKRIESLKELIAKLPANQELTRQLNETEESLKLCKKYNWFLNEVLLLKRPNTEGFHL